MDLALRPRLRLGVSSCLLGEAVRYDGGHKRHPWIADRLGPLVEWVPCCPEVEAGLGVPREPVQLERRGRAIEVRGVESGADHTARIEDFSRRRIDSLGLDELDGFVLKSRSPSCGIAGVVVHGDADPQARAPGRFAHALEERDPRLPLCDEGQFEDPATRRHFLERAQARARWRRFLDGTTVDRDAADLFLAGHDLLLVCRGEHPLRVDGCEHDASTWRALGQALHDALRQPAQPEGHVHAMASVLEHASGLHPAERDGLGILLTELRRAHIDPEVARQYARGLVIRAGDPWLRRQHYFDPFPLNHR